MDEQNNKLGWLGIWLSIIGLILPILIAIAGGLFFDMDVVSLCMLLFVALELPALGCGIVARQTRPGKAAASISGSSLVLFVLFLAFLTPIRMESSPANGGQPVKVSEPAK